MNKVMIALLLATGCAAAVATAPTRAPSPVDWARLKNPVYQRPGWAVKDATMAYQGGAYYLFFSAFFVDGGPAKTSGVRCHVAGVRTRDFVTYSEPLFVWRGTEHGESGWNGMCSPNLTRIGDTWYLTYNGWKGNASGENNKLFYATSKDLEHWSPHQRLASNILAWDTRAIDAAIAVQGEKLILFYKDEQTPKVAVGQQMGRDGWRAVGETNLGWYENAQPLLVDEKWHLVGTGEGHRPFLARLDGDANDEKAWLRWTKVLAPIPVAAEPFGSEQPANAAFLADFRELDGHFYLLYAGRTENRSYAGRGDCRLGLARSADLVRWRVAGE